MPKLLMSFSNWKKNKIEIKAEVSSTLIENDQLARGDLGDESTTCQVSFVSNN